MTVQLCDHVQQFDLCAVAPFKFHQKLRDSSSQYHIDIKWLPQAPIDNTISLLSKVNNVQMLAASIVSPAVT